MDGNTYWFARRPPDTAHQHPFLVFDCQDRLHFPLTVFAKEALTRVAATTVPTYLQAILPFFTYLATDAGSLRANLTWDAPPEPVRQAITDYLVQRLRCQVHAHRLGFQHVALTEGTRSTVRVFLSALKLFYLVMYQQRYYPFPNPLVDGVSVALADIEGCLRSEDGFPRMPTISGVAAPRHQRRLSDSYFKLEGEDWTPHVIDDPTFFARILTGGQHLAHWGLREQCVTRMLFESGGRVSEVTGLTLEDWVERGMRQEAHAFSKGSHGQRVKYLRFSAETAKLLRRYVDAERILYDPHHATLDDYLTRAAHHQVDLRTAPLFLSRRGTPYSAKTYRAHAWNPACQAAGIDADVHQARHWYVTMHMRYIYELAKVDGDVQGRRRALIAYMHWQSGTDTLAAYDHYFDLARHAEVQDALHTRMAAEVAQHVAERQRGQASVPTGAANSAAPRLPLRSDPPDYAYLIQLGGGRRDR